MIILDVWGSKTRDSAFRHGGCLIRDRNSITFVLCLVNPMLHVSLDCPFLIGPLVFSHGYARQDQEY